MYQGYDGSAALYGQDPRLAKLYRQRRFAEQLAAAGADSSPVQSPWQAANRLAQSLIGNLEMAGADRGADLIGEEKQAENAKMAQQYAALIGGPPTLPPVAAAVAGQPAPAGGTVAGIHRAESGGSMQPGIYGDGGRSAGPMQVQESALADVNRALGTTYTHGQLSEDPELGKRVGEQYYELLKARFGGDDRKAAAAYNAGPGRVTAAIAAYGDNWEQGLPTATRENYLPRVFGQQTAQPPPNAEIVAYRQQAQQARAWAASAANNSDPRVQAMARNAMAMADHADQRANQLETRADQQAFQRQEALQRQAEAERVRQETRALQDQKLAQDRDIAVRNTDFSQANTLRDEFTKLTSDFRVVQSAYENIRSSAQANDGAGDMSLLYSYVKLLDPTSVVRESEFATAAASGSYGERIQGAVERILSGARMPESLRQSFLREARNIYENQRKGHDTIADQYSALAKQYNIDPDKVVTRYTRPQEPAAASPELDPTSDDDGPWKRPGPVSDQRRRPGVPPPPPNYRIID